MKAPRLTFDSNGYLDLKLEDGKFAWAEDGTQAAQHATLRLLIFKGEYALNGELTGLDDEGTDWYGTIFDMSKSKAEKILEIKRAILETYGIERIITFSWTRTAAHTVTINALVKTIWGDMEISEELTPL